MFDKIKKFWNDHGETVEIIALGITTITLATSLNGIHRINKIIDENNLNDLFYGDDEDDPEEES